MLRDKRVYEFSINMYNFMNFLFGNPETINLLFITVYPYISTNECDAVARPIPLPIWNKRENWMYLFFYVFPTINI